LVSVFMLASSDGPTRLLVGAVTAVAGRARHVRKPFIVSASTL